MLILVCLLHALCGVAFTACMNLAMFWTDRHCVNTLLPLSALHGAGSCTWLVYLPVLFIVVVSLLTWFYTLHVILHY